MAAGNDTRGSAAVDRYLGDRKSQLRHGYGVYRYPNGFKYEGEWVNGRRHGQGKLTLGDNGYYEGSFVHGEIEGHGFRLFGLTGTTYTGQFHQGEMHGDGLMQYRDGSRYEGEWSYNKQEGQGIVVGADGSLYEGEFHNHQKHGSGVHIYANGDRYEGDWVNGMRHGQGLLRCKDGTIYDGQWKADKYHGEGAMNHACGITYEGMWICGHPEFESTAIRPVKGKRHDTISVEQGKTFSIRLECVDENRKLVHIDTGRTFSVTAAYEKNSLKKQVSRPSIVELAKLPILPTPLGDYIPYHIMQSSNVAESSGSSTPQTVSAPEVQSRQSINPSTEDLKDKRKHIETGLQSSSLSPRSPRITALAGEHTKSMYSTNQIPAIRSATEGMCEPEKALSREGKLSFKDLFLPPPPLPSSSSSQVIPSSSSEHKKLAAKELSTDTSPPGSPSGSTTKLSPRLGIQRSKSPSPTKKSIASPMKKVLSSKAAGKKLIEKRLKQDKHCPTGKYLIIITEVTSPPFLGTTLPPCYIPVSVTPLKVLTAPLNV